MAGDGGDAVGGRLAASGCTSGIAPGASFDELDAEAESRPPGAEGLLFAPYLAGERTPHADPDARGAFVGLQLRHDRGALVRAVLEGVAFGLRDALDAVRGLGVDVSVAAPPGRRASPLWLEIVASVLDLPLELTESEEGSAFGAALLGGVCRRRLRRRARGRRAVRATTRSGRAGASLARLVRRAPRRLRALYPALRPPGSGTATRA